MKTGISHLYMVQLILSIPGVFGTERLFNYKELCSVHSCVPKVKEHFLTFYLSTKNDLWWKNKM